MRDAFDITIDEVIARIRKIKEGEDLGGKDYSGGFAVANGS